MSTQRNGGRSSAAAQGCRGQLPHNLEIANRRLLAEARVLFAAVALLMSLFEETGAHATLLALVLIGYGAYSAVHMWRLAYGDGDAGAGTASAHWIDVVSYSLAVALSGGLDSEFLVFLLFPVLAASFRRGFAQGVAVTLTCASLFAAAALIQHALDPSWDWQYVSFGPVAVLVVAGLAVSRWGNSEATLMRRLALSNDVNRLLSPSFGLDHAIFRFAELLHAYQRADACIVILKDPNSTGCLLYEVAGTGERPARGKHIGADLAEALPALPPDLALLYSARRWPWQRPFCGAYDPATLETKPVDDARLCELANLLEARSFISLPVRSRNQTIGRFHLISQRLRYARSDIAFMAQVAGQAALLIENMQLLEKLFLEAAAEERRRISLDLHDGTIQPYIGLKLGLEALRRKVAGGHAVAGEVDDLIRKAADGIEELRRYVGGLREQEREQQRDSLVPVLRCQAQKFSEFYGIDVEVVAERDLAVKGSLLREIKHIVHEALSNIRRHTAAERAVINLQSDEGRLVLEFLNDKTLATEGTASFFPRSIGERAKELGGAVEVEQRAGGYTAVLVELPV